MKPSQTPDLTGTFLIFFAKLKAVATVSFDVFSATTTSKSFIMLAGEKKCKPITLLGLSTTEAISFTFK